MSSYRWATLASSNIASCLRRIEREHKPTQEIGIGCERAESVRVVVHEAEYLQQDDRIVVGLLAGAAGDEAARVHESADHCEQNDAHVEAKLGVEATAEERVLGVERSIEHVEADRVEVQAEIAVRRQVLDSRRV